MCRKKWHFCCTALVYSVIHVWNVQTYVDSPLLDIGKLLVKHITKHYDISIQMCTKLLTLDTFKWIYHCVLYSNTELLVCVDVLH